MNLLTAEVRKVTSLRFWWALALPPILVGIFTSTIASAISESVGEVDVEGGFATFGLYVSLGFAMAFVAVFAAVNGGTEFRHDTITTSFVTASGRDGIIGAKFAVTALFALGYGLVVELGSVVCLMLFSPTAFALSGHILAILLAGLLAVVLWSLIGVGLGLLLGSPSWAAIVIVAWYPFGEIIVISILEGLGIHNVSTITPAATTLATLTAGDSDSAPYFMSWPFAPIVLALWAVAVAAAGWWRTRERDIG
ncbi:hypothetical protein [Rhodococcoides yunnanense]|uniref:hypothetical protein n=1 Tax=Rhodococcoides yunnanense TaxID=278209 RepID=UPI000933C6EB|nr:hypothetical protein [Rhodococcus yunnanensis]